jgi:predicted TIM-barrel fold metal-dependent hydrolase
MSTPFVDAHIHLWELGHPELSYGWLEGDVDPVLGPLAEMQIPLWNARRYLHATRHLDLRAAVHVQAAGAPGDPVAETRWLAQENDETGVPHVIIGRVEMLGEGVGSVLDRHLEVSSLVRGARDMTLAGRLDDPRLDGALEALERRGMSWDLHCFHEEMAIARRVAQRHQGVPTVLGHAGFPLERTDQYFAAWAAGIRELAKAEHVRCKISGLGMADHDWTVASWRPWFETCVEAFGVDRCMLGSNWPVDRSYASIDAVLGAFEELTAFLTAAERAALFSDNAIDHYRIPVEVGA